MGMYSSSATASFPSHLSRRILGFWSRSRDESVSTTTAAQAEQMYMPPF